VEANAASKIDVIGLSYYPMWHGSVDSLRRSLTAIANNHNYKVAVAEYADKHREVNDVVFALPANKRLGTFVWEPEEFDGDSSRPLFDWNYNTRRRETNARMALYPVMAEDYGIGNNNSTGVVNNGININTDKRGSVSTKFITTTRGGTVAYNLNVPGVITVYGINGRKVGEMVVDKAGMLKSLSLKPGAYILKINRLGVID